MASVLVIDDSAAQRAALRSALDEARMFDHILEAEDGLRGLKRLLSDQVDLVICDVEMPGLDGDKLIHVALARGVPILMLTGVMDARRRARLIHQGARDVITKPFHPLDLIARIDLHLELVKLHHELETKNAELEALSTTDALTGLRNRRFLDEALDLEFKRAARQGTPLSVVMADIDHFKQLNDRYGHPAGDSVLRAVSNVFSGELRDTDVGGRFGGEEFLMIVASPSEGAEIVAERWRSGIEALSIPIDGEDPVKVTVSMGVASRSSQANDPAALVARADAALYRAKDGGRNCIVVDDAED